MTVHGLWPNYQDGTYPQFCDKAAAFDGGKLSDIKTQLEEEWPTFYNREDDFWSHEWLKHGTCAAKIMPDELSYFSAVLKLQYKYDLAVALVAASIRPSDTEKYRRADVEAAISKAWGVDALVHCDARGQLTEVWMCVDRALEPINCKLSTTTRCEYITIPKLPFKGGPGAEDPAALDGMTVAHDAAGVAAGDPSPLPTDSAAGGFGPGGSAAHVTASQGAGPSPGGAGSELLRTCILAVAGAMMALILISTLAVSALQRRQPCAPTCTVCRSGSSASGHLPAHHQTLIDNEESSESLTRPLL